MKTHSVKKLKKKPISNRNKNKKQIKKLQYTRL